MAAPVDTAELFADHRDGLLRYFARRTADAEAALDLVAETFAQAVRARRRCRAATREDRAAWLYGIARNQLAAYHRRGYAEQRAVGKLGLERPPLTEAVLREVEQRAGLGDVRIQLADALGSLTAETRAAVALRVVDELPYAEVASRLGIEEPAARARVSRGLSRLADLLDRSLLEEVVS
ncbi:MAG: RNA polymerase sigma factor [Patulibacter minatonensis]